MGFFSRLFGGERPDPKEAVRHTPEELARRLKVPLAALQAVKPIYRDVQIKKRRGGTRTLSVPDEALKQMQRTILRRLLGRLESHPASHGFEQGRSIVTNALPHVGKSVVLKMDVKGFFPATTEKRVRAYFKLIGWNKDAVDILTRLTTYKGGLPQGAPTSPRLSNLINVPLDARLEALGRKIGAAYTRYADDLTFSLKPIESGHSSWEKIFGADRVASERHRVAALIVATKRILASYEYTLHQDKKLRICRRHERQVVTGVVVNVKPALPREMRRKLRAIAHHLATGREITMTTERLAGMLAYKRMIEAGRK